MSTPSLLPTPSFFQPCPVVSQRTSFGIQGHYAGLGEKVTGALSDIQIATKKALKEDYDRLMYRDSLPGGTVDFRPLFARQARELPGPFNTTPIPYSSGSLFERQEQPRRIDFMDLLRSSAPEPSSFMFKSTDKRKEEKRSWEFAHMDHGLPIHAGPGQDPHVTIRDSDGPLGGGTWHVPYRGQTTLGMFGIGKRGESMEHVAEHKLGTLDLTKATYTPWLK